MQDFPFPIITYQVITGNYNRSATNPYPCCIITYQVITGNYNLESLPNNVNMYYNIPSNNRELQQGMKTFCTWEYYNIPSNNRELQRIWHSRYYAVDYNIPSNNRELQQT